MLVKALLAAAVAPLFVAAQLKVTYPSSSTWWVNDSVNKVAWSGKPDTAPDFTVFLANKNVQLLSGDQALSAVTPAFMTSLEIPQAHFNPGTGYYIKLSHTVLGTVFAQSDEFEIKPLGATYAAETPVATATASASGSLGVANSTDGAAASASSTAAGSAGVANVANLPIAAAAAAAAVYVMA